MIKDLLLPMTGTDGDDNALSAALALAAHQNAHLVVLVVVDVVALIFGIEQHEVDADIEGLFAEQAGYFEQYTHTAAAVVGAEYGFFLVFRILIGVKTAVPMRSQQDASRVFGFVLPDDVDAVERAAFVVWRLKFLFDHRKAVAFEFTGQPGSAFAVRFGIGHTGAKIHLFFDKKEG